MRYVREVVVLMALFLTNTPLQPAQAAPALQLYSASFVELAGRPGHQGLFPIQGAPHPGAAAMFEAIILGPVASATLNLSDASGVLIATATLSHPMNSDADSPDFVGSVAVPTVPFVVLVTAKDQSGTSHSLSTASPPPLIVPQTLHIRLMPLDSVLSPGTPAAFLAQVTNGGAADSFTFSATATPTSVITISPTVVFLGTNQAATTVLSTIVPPNGDPLVSYGLSVSAAGARTGAAASASIKVELSTTPGITVTTHTASSPCGIISSAGGLPALTIVLEATPSFDPHAIDQTSIYLAGNVQPRAVAFRSSLKSQGCPGDAPKSPNDMLAVFDRKAVEAALDSLFQSSDAFSKRSAVVLMTAQTPTGIPVVGVVTTIGNN